MRSSLMLLAAVVPLALGAACSPAPAAPAVPPPTTALPSALPALPPLPDAPKLALYEPLKEGASAQGIAATCDAHLKSAQAQLDALKALKGRPASDLTYANTIGRFDDVVLEIKNASEFAYLMSVSHPDKAVRDAAKPCEPKAERFTTGMYLDAAVASVIKAYAAKGEVLPGERARLLAETLREFRRNGLELPEAQQARLRELNTQITEKGQKFGENIAATVGRIEVPRASLDGLPADFVKRHPPNKGGKVEITTDYPDYFPFVTYAKDREAALKLYVLFTNRGGDENVALLKDILAMRHEKAKLLGYPSWAAYAVEPRMAKTPDAVRAFLQKIRDAVRQPADEEMAELLKEHARAGGKPPKGKLPPPDRMYLSDRVRAKKYAFDSKELSSYFEVRAVTTGLLAITARLYGLEYKPIDGPFWHPDVAGYEVWSQGKAIGHFYLDLYPRADKFKHAAMFSVRTAKRLPDGTTQLPAAALECNFPRPADPADRKAEPALMSHLDVVTFFHEFGHVLHHVLTQSELASYSGTNAVRDFVEAPSQMFEEWPWSREVLDLFAKHHKTGAKIPDALFQAMQRSRSFGRALDTQRQVFLAMADQELHTRVPPVDTTKVVEEVQTAVDSFAYVPGTHFESSFGHLIDYDAGYYGYSWALSLSRDVLTRFKKEGLLNTETARAWRESVLAKGGGEDERTMVARFLGRPPGDDAFIAYLRGAN